MSNYLYLRFNNAGIIRTKKSHKKIFDEPITYYQLANMLCVLFNERPSPINRNVFYDIPDYIKNMAYNAKLKLDSFQYKDKKENYHYCKEKIHIRKPYWNAWNPNSQIHWRMIEGYLGDYYNEFIELLDEIFQTKNIDNLVPFNKLPEKCDNLTKEDKEKIINFSFSKNKGKGGIKDYLIGSGKNCDEKKTFKSIACYFTKEYYDKKNKKSFPVEQTLENEVGNVERHRGEIIVPINNDEIDKLRNSKGCATILDSGIVVIKGIYKGNEINDKGFSNVKKPELL